FVPMLLLLIPAGDLIDRFDRKWVLSLSWLGCAACSLILLWLSWRDEHDPAWFYGALVVYGCSRAFMGPALQSPLPQIVPRARLAQASATNPLLSRAATILGPVAGGIFYAIGGGELTSTLCVAGFIAGLLLLRRVSIQYAEPAPVAEVSSQPLSPWQRVTAGIHFIRSLPLILGTISLVLFVVLLGGVIAL